MDELVEFGVIEIGNGPKGHCVAGPMTDLKAAERSGVGKRGSGVRRGPDEHIDRVLAALIHERRDGSTADRVDAGADERKAEARKRVVSAMTKGRE